MPALPKKKAAGKSLARPAGKTAAKPAAKSVPKLALAGEALITALADLQWKHGPDFALWHEILRKAGIDPKTVTPGIVHAAERAAGRRLRDGFAAHNADPKRAFDCVLFGDAELDPDLNADHPTHGRAWHAKQVETRDKESQVSRINQLRQERGESPYQPREPKPLKAPTIIAAPPASAAAKPKPPKAFRLGGKP